MDAINTTEAPPDSPQAIPFGLGEGSGTGRQATPPKEDKKAPEEPKKEKAAEPERDPFLEELNKSLGYVVEDKRPPVEKKEPETKEPEKPKATEPKPEADPPKEPKKVTVKREPDRLRQIVQEEFKKRETEKPAPAPEPKPEPAKEPEKKADAYEEGLGEGEREELNFARYAEKANPTAPWSKGLADKIVKFFKAVDEYSAKAKAENPERTLDERDEEFQDWIRDHRPEIPPTERRKLERQQIKEEARAEAEAGFKPTIEKLEREQHALKVKPEVEKKITAYAEGLLELLGPKSDKKDSVTAPLIERMNEVGLDGLIAEQPFHGPILRDIYNNGVGMAEEYLQLERGLKKSDPKDPNHAWLANFIEGQAAQFKAHGENLEQGGRSFVSPAELHRIAKEKPAEAARHWTFTEDHVLAMIQMLTIDKAEEKIKEINERLEKAGYQRAKPAAVKKDELPKKEKNGAPENERESVRARPSVAPGAAPGGTVDLSNRPFSDHEMEALVGKKWSEVKGG